MTEAKKTLKMPLDKYLVRMKNQLHTATGCDGPSVERHNKLIFILQEHSPFVKNEVDNEEKFQEDADLGNVGEAFIKAAQKEHEKELENLKAENAELKKEVECLRDKNNELEKMIEHLNNTIRGQQNALCDRVAINISHKLRGKNNEKLKNGMGYGSADFAVKGNWYKGYETDPDDEK